MVVQHVNSINAASRNCFNFEGGYSIILNLALDNGNFDPQSSLANNESLRDEDPLKRSVLVDWVRVYEKIE